MVRPLVVGIVNITSDSFSDGGAYLAPDRAIEHARDLREQGADIVELGAASSNPNAGSVPAGEEIARLTPVISALRDVRISVDSTKSEVQRFALGQDVELLNDIRGFADGTLYPELAAASQKLVVMHSMSDAERADRAERTTEEVFASLWRFFDRRIGELEAAGISRERIVLDPGMGFFLSALPDPSHAVLERLPELKERYHLPIMVCVSRKSFLRAGAPLGSEALRSRTLSAELTAARNGADYIRTHEPKQLVEALAAGGPVV